MKNQFIPAGKPFQVATATAYLSGEIFVEGQLVGICEADAADGYVTIKADGPIEFPKDGSAYAIGDQVDVTAQGTAVPAVGGTIGGVVVKAALAGDAYVMVKVK